MSPSKNYQAQFTNRYGEEWCFEYDAATGEGLLRGSDVNWQSYRVIQGFAFGLLLSEEELVWLRRVWREATAPGAGAGPAPRQESP